MAAGLAARGSGTVCRPERRRCWYATERLPAEDERLAPRRELDDRRPGTSTTFRRRRARAGVACLSGRTAAYRRSVVIPLLPYLEREIFLGKLCISGDDGRLTWLVLGSGYKTVYQANARAVSMFPDSLRAFLKQRVRWSRNSLSLLFDCDLEGLALAPAIDHPNSPSSRSCSRRSR